ncbi:MAG TPA: hypothetical protein VFS15_09430 [Kofleriaceae bacterium]|nr:hypothetical protein [Kofleriaceae bacterium]
MRYVLAAVLLFSFACGDDGGGEEAFPTFQECFDDHHVEEALPTQKAIVVCCLEHPINGVTQVCGDTAADCEAYLATNLDATSATQTEVTAACADYETQKDM